MAKRRRQPRPKQGFLHHWGPPIGIALCAVLTAWAVLPSKQTVASGPADDATRLSLRELDHLLTSYRGCLLPAQRTVLIDKMRANVADLVPGTLWVLARPEQERFEDTADVVSLLGMPEAAEPLRSVAHGGGKDGRGAAWRALDRYEPLEDETLRELIGDGNPRVAAAGLAIVARRPTPAPALLEPILRSLQHSDELVRAAALAVVPAELGSESIPLLLELAEDPVAGDAANALLSRVPVGPEVAAVVVKRLTENIERLLRLQPFVRRYAGQAEVATLLWRAAETSDSMPIRIAALGCLEEAKDASGIPFSASNWPLRLQYFVARIRIAAGQLEGIDQLLQFAAADADADAEMRSVAGLARLALSRLAGLPPHEEMPALLAWREGLRSVPEVVLPAVPQ